MENKVAETFQKKSNISDEKLSPDMNGTKSTMDGTEKDEGVKSHEHMSNGKDVGTHDKESQTNEPKINYRGWKSMPYIIGNETFEKLGAIGTLANLLIYLTTVFNLKSYTATNIINIFSGTTNFSTLIGAFLSDTYFGRFKTLAVCTVASFLGLQTIQLTAGIKWLHPPSCGNNTTCVEPTPGQMAVLLLGFGLLIIGAAGIRPCNLAFGADQFNPNTESGKKGIKSFFNWYFFMFTFAQMVSLTLIVYVQSNLSWAIGLEIPAILMLISSIFFFTGSKIYVKVKAQGSPITSVVRVIVVSVKKSKLKAPDQPWLSLFNYIPPKSINSRLKYTDQFRCLNKAAIRTPQDQVNPNGSPAKPWKLCSMQQVEEVKCLIRVLPIWLSAIIYYLTIVQQQTYAIFQATQADRQLGNTSFKIPPASYVVFLMLSLTFFIPLYDRVIVPFLRRITGKEGGITVLQRMGIGFFFCIVAMIVSGIVEERRRTIALTKPTLGTYRGRGEISSMSALWLVPQFFLTGLAEAFASIGQVEFYYKQFPENMRSIAGSLYYCGMAGSSYLSSLLISIVHRTTGRDGDGGWLQEDLNNGRLDYFYYLVAGLLFVNLLYFLICSRWYQYKEASDDTLGTDIEMKEPEKIADLILP